MGNSYSQVWEVLLKFPADFCIAMGLKPIAIVAIFLN